MHWLYIDEWLPPHPQTGWAWLFPERWQWVKEWARDIIANNMNGASINLTNHIVSIDLGKTRSFPSWQMSLRSSCNSNCWSQNIWNFYEKAKHVNTNIMVWYNLHDTCSNYKWYTQRKWHHQTYTGRYLSTKHQLRRQVFKNILAMHRKQMQFHKHQIGRWNGRFKTRVLWVEEGGVLW